MDKNCLSYWYPVIRDCVRTPETHIIRTDIDLVCMLDGESPDGLDSLVQSIKEAGDDVGYPCFLRTGQGSGKHNWNHTCFVQDRDAVLKHVASLVEWSVMVDILGLPTDVWVVRKMLPTVPVAVLPSYRDMPLCREFRCFVSDGNVQCIHPYWPKQAAEEGFSFLHRVLPPDWEDTYKQLCHLEGYERRVIENLASIAGKAIGGDWSIDILDTEEGWYVTDMAEAKRSFHWPGCLNVEALED